MRGVGITVYPRLTPAALAYLADAKPHSITLHNIVDGAAFAAVRKAVPDALVGIGIGCNPFANLAINDGEAASWIENRLEAAARHKADFVDLNCESGPVRKGRRTGWVRYAKDDNRDSELRALEERASLLLSLASRVGVPVLVTTHDLPTMHPVPKTLMRDNRVTMLRLMRYISTSTKEEARAKRMTAVNRVRRSERSIEKYEPDHAPAATTLRGWGCTIAAYGELLDSTDHSNVWALPFVSSDGRMDRVGARAVKAAIACRRIGGNAAGSIARAQECLAKTGHYEGNIDGILGEETIAAIERNKRKENE